MTEEEVRMFLALCVFVCLYYIVRAYSAMYQANEKLSYCLASCLAENFAMKLEAMQRAAKDGVPNSE